VIKRLATTGQTTPKKRPGRSRISSGRADRVLHCLATRDRFKGSTELSINWFEVTGTVACSSIVKRRLITDELKSSFCKETTADQVSEKKTSGFCESTQALDCGRLEKGV